MVWRKLPCQRATSAARELPVVFTSAPLFRTPDFPQQAVDLLARPDVGVAELLETLKQAGTAMHAIKTASRTPFTAMLTPTIHPQEKPDGHNRRAPMPNRSRVHIAHHGIRITPVTLPDTGHTPVCVSGSTG